MSLTVRQFAQEEQMAVSTVLDLIHAGDLVAYSVGRKVGGKPQWRISDEECLAFRERRRSTPAPMPVKRRVRRANSNVKDYFGS